MMFQYALTMHDSFWDSKIFMIIRALDAMPFWQMILTIIGSVIAVTILLVVVTHLFRKPVITFELSGYMGNDMIAAVFGLLLAFLTVSMYDTNKKAEASVYKEANDLVGILLNSQQLNNAPLIRNEVENYTKMLIEQQWPCMISGDLEKAWKLEPQMINPLYKVILKSGPAGDIQDKFYETLPGLLEDLTTVHRLRLLQADFHLPIQFWKVIVLMTLLTLWFLAYMNPWKGLHSFIPVLIPASIIALSLGLMVSLHFPFLGPFAVSSEPFRSGYLNFSSGVNGVDIMPGDVKNRSLQEPSSTPH